MAGQLTRSWNSHFLWSLFLQAFPLFQQKPLSFPVKLTGNETLALSLLEGLKNLAISTRNMASFV